MNKNKLNISLILLAGGVGSRMKLLATSTPKSLLPVYNESLLQRHIRQAKEAGIGKVVVSTKPEWHDVFFRHLSKGKLVENVIILPNKNHKYGSLPALWTTTKKIKSDYFLMSFADIFSFDNPYTNFANTPSESPCIIGISEPFDKQELTRGGIVFIADNKVQSIKERPLKNNNKGYRWNGLSCFFKELIPDLSFYLKHHPKDSPSGDFFEFWRIKGGNITYRKCSDFINVNTSEDLLLSSLYNYYFSTGNKEIEEIANHLRKQLLQNN